MAVASLRRDSPSMRVDILMLAPSSLSIATTATGSVAETIAPNRNASDQVSESS